ncbi:MAG TPA: hypothetical protein PLN33_19210 [Hyphomonadaceae bacterium]|jgi:hypothetical protein|nr:hypothetical protein [Hyphomonadaceae bacterium]HPN06993.1 hypothetical protein [Hyphomonadaceae bacterium]
MRPRLMIAGLMIAGLTLASTALLAACGEKEEDIACCAIDPKARCDSELAGIGITPAEMALIRSGDRICPTMDLTAERIREIDARWPASCRASGAISPGYAMASGMCRPAPEANPTPTDPPIPGPALEPAPAPPPQ